MTLRLFRRTGAQPVRRAKGKRLRFSLNGLAIQLSAFALSFTLVALLVVSGSQAAFVEESEVLADYVPIGTAAPSATEGRRPSRPAPTPAPEVPPVEEPPVLLVAEPEEEPVEEPPVPDIEVELSDSDEGTAMFPGETMLPGVPLDRCIEVSYDGADNPGPVLLYAAAASGALAPYLDLTVHMGSAASGAFGGCGSFAASESVYSGTLADFASAHSNYASGRFTWNPSDEQERRSFRFRLTVQDVPAAAGKSASFGFTWRTEAP
ncbi:hypothetical protein E4P39_15675 [Blastococcus sp. CT_GayMR19]|uniref:hypothetical protein n=1 Tax=Blastococcus sp. CT_GayMR19 TaxID=2559608 RepID=UPI0010733F12|nr:hypothetical protein [Blastococcus sp. CT_GayMR19]TFV72929.1 hypothetical protein E4P39_15675 [Blastococcus sp. CT_GayMR19]